MTSSFGGAMAKRFFMTSFYSLSLSLSLLSILNAQTTFGKFHDKSCREAVAFQLILELQRLEPTAQLKIVKAKNGDVLGLTDFQNIYPTIDFSSTAQLSSKVMIDTYRFDETQIFIHYILKKSANSLEKQCIVKSIQVQTF